jgi:hypothetical protein
MTGNFISANFLELRQYSYYVMSKIVFFNLYIFLDLLYLIVFFNLFAKFQHLYLKSCNMGDSLISICLRPPTQKGSTVQHSPCLLFWLPSPLYLDYLERDQNMQDQSIWLSDLPQYLEKNICFTQFESPTILPDWELPQTF